jgi:hypothetical protein
MKLRAVRYLKLNFNKIWTQTWKINIEINLWPEVKCGFKWAVFRENRDQYIFVDIIAPTFILFLQIEWNL